MSLSYFENSIIKQSKYDCEIFEESDVILVWPKDWKPNWDKESQVTNCTKMAQWLNCAFNTMRNWTSVDPNTIYQKKNCARDRLIFVCINGKGDFQFYGIPRPYIGLRDMLVLPLPGTEEWFGWLLHELSHDFFHEERVGPGHWGEGMCDYSRYYLLLSQGMLNAAMKSMERIQQSRSDDRYGAPAKLLLQYEKKHNLCGPKELWNKIKGEDFNIIIGKPTWK